VRARPWSGFSAPLGFNNRRRAGIHNKQRIASTYVDVEGLNVAIPPADNDLGDRKNPDAELGNESRHATTAVFETSLRARIVITICGAVMLMCGCLFAILPAYRQAIQSSPGGYRLIGGLVIGGVAILWLALVKGKQLRDLDPDVAIRLRKMRWAIYCLIGFGIVMLVFAGLVLFIVE
jgi:hypothetical protein